MFGAKKVLSTTLAAAALVLPLLTACGGEPAATPTAGAASGGGGAATATPAGNNTIGSSSAATTLTFWNGFTGSDRAGIEGVTKKFTDANPTIKVNMDIEPWDSLMQKLLSAMSTGTGPDVVAIHFQYIPQYAKSGLVMDLS